MLRATLSRCVRIPYCKALIAILTHIIPIETPVDDHINRCTFRCLDKN